MVLSTPLKSTSGFYPTNATTYERYLCSDDEATLSYFRSDEGPVKEGTYIPDCEFPFVNKGFLNEEDYEEKDCSLTYGEVLGSEYTTVCMMYAIPAILIALVAAHNTYVLQKNRVARGSKTVSLSETMSRLTTLMMASLFLACLDIEMYNNTYHVLVHNCLVGVCTCSCLTEVLLVIESWVVMVNMKGKTANTPKWMHPLKVVTLSLMWFAEFVVHAFLEHILGEIPSQVHGAYNGSVHVIKNMISAGVMLTWMGVNINIGRTLRKQLGGDKASKEQVKIRKFTRTITFCLLLGTAYKAMRVTRWGSVVYEKPPCGVSSVQMLSSMMNLIGFIVVIIQRPASKSKVAAAGKGSGTSTVVSN